MQQEVNEDAMDVEPSAGIISSFHLHVIVNRASPK